MILHDRHDAHTSGHPGRDNTTQLIRRTYWWPGMGQWIAKYVEGCPTCQQNKNCPQTKVPLFRIPAPIEAQPFQVVAIDLITQLPNSGGYDTILTIVDHGCTRGAIFLPCKGTITRQGITNLYTTHLLPWFEIGRASCRERG